MTPDDIRRFVNREWARIAAAKDRAWRTAKHTPADDLRIGDELRRYVLTVRKDWPSAGDRDEDLRVHIRVTEALGAVSVRSQASGMPLDIVLAGPGLEDEFLARAIVVDLDDIAVPVISPEDLLITKVLAGRPKDVEDIRGILRLRATSLDLGYIRRTLSAVETALGQSDLQPLFEAELLR